MTLIVDCLTDRGILIGADCKKTDEKYHKSAKTQKIFSFQSKDKMTYVFCSSGLFCIDPRDACKRLSAKIRAKNIINGLRQLAFDNKKGFIEKNILFDHTEGCYLMLYYYHKETPYISYIILNYQSEKLKEKTYRLQNGIISSNLLGKDSECFYKLISVNMKYSQMLKYSLQTKEPISYKNGSELVQWVLEKYPLHYPDRTTGLGIQMGILNQSRFEWIRKDFDQ